MAIVRPYSDTKGTILTEETINDNDLLIVQQNPEESSLTGMKKVTVGVVKGSRTIGAIQSSLANAFTEISANASSISSLAEKAESISTVANSASSAIANASYTASTPAGKYISTISQENGKIETEYSSFVNTLKDENTGNWNKSEVIPPTAGIVATELERLSSGALLSSEALASEASRAQASEASLASKITTETSRATGVETTISTAVTTEASRAKASEASLSSNISSEVTRAQASEASLSSRITAISNTVVSNYASLAYNISTEASRAKASEASLASKIDTSVSALKDSFDTNIASNASSVNAPQTKAVFEYGKALKEDIIEMSKAMTYEGTVDNASQVHSIEKQTKTNVGDTYVASNEFNLYSLEFIELDPHEHGKTLKNSMWRCDSTTCNAGEGLYKVESSVKRGNSSFNSTAMGIGYVWDDDSPDTAYVVPLANSIIVEGRTTESDPIYLNVGDVLTFTSGTDLLNNDLIDWLNAHGKFGRYEATIDVRVGCLLIRNNLKYSSSAPNEKYWDIINTSETNVVFDGTKAISGNFAVFKGSTGRIIKDAGFNKNDLSSCVQSALEAASLASEIAASIVDKAKPFEDAASSSASKALYYEGVARNAASNITSYETLSNNLKNNIVNYEEVASSSKDAILEYESIASSSAEAAASFSDSANLEYIKDSASLSASLAADSERAAEISASAALQYKFTTDNVNNRPTGEVNIYLFGQDSTVPRAKGDLSKAYFSSNVYFTRGGDFNATSLTAISARALKDNIRKSDIDALNLLNSTEVVNFNYKDDDKKVEHIGFIADDTDSLLSTPEHNRMDVNNCIGVLIKAVQELSKEIKELKSK